MIKTTETNKEISIGRYTWSICVVILSLCGLTLLLNSCEEANQEPDLKEKAGVNFLLKKIPYGVVSTTFRNDSGGEPETAVVHLAGNLYMHATLEADPVNATRGAIDLEPNTKLRIVAYKENDTVICAQADYKIVDQGALSPVTDPLMVESGNTYKFVAYSFNSKTVAPPNHEEILPAIFPEFDLLWGKTTEEITAHHHTINITLNHKFSKMTVRVASSNGTSSAPNITGINNVSIKPGYGVKLKVIDGKFDALIDTTQTLTFLPFAADTAVISQSRTVCTNKINPTIIEIGSVTIGATTYPGPFSINYNMALEAGKSYTLRVHLKKDGGIIADNSPPANLTMYVGAFWKASQTGERLITIKRPTQVITNVYPNVQVNSADGAWTAQVLVGNDWIVLDTQKSTDTGVGTNAPQHNGNDPGFDAMYPVNSTLRTVTGTMNAFNPQIYFRIGLTGQYIPAPGHPVRYGVVLLTYRNNELKHRIWIRQGEEDDYLLCNSDPTCGCSDPLHLKTPRTVTKRFTAYNLTAAKLDTVTDLQGATPAVNPGIFTDYPLQAGAFFQWADVNPGIYSRIRWAWNPYTAAAVTPNGYWFTPAIPANTFWNTLKNNHETCPPGYRRPNDGYIDRMDDGNSLTLSEIRQSLFEHPRKEFNFDAVLTNSKFGYYADGFFDRRLMVNLLGGTTGWLTTVAYGTRNIAHAGVLYYNSFPGDHTNASLFFPVGGNRFPEQSLTGGHLNESMGRVGGYWASTYATKPGIYTGPSFLRLVNTDLAAKAGPWIDNNGTGYHIRCVRDE